MSISNRISINRIEYPDHGVSEVRIRETNTNGENWRMLCDSQVSIKPEPEE